MKNLGKRRKWNDRNATLHSMSASRILSLFANKLEMSPKMGTIVMAHKDIDVDIVVVASQFNRKWIKIVKIKYFSLNQSNNHSAYYSPRLRKLVNSPTTSHALQQ